MTAETITVEQLRDEVRRAVEATSSRAVARAVSLSHAGLLRFVNGKGRLYAPSKRRLTAWYLERAVRPLPNEALAAVGTRFAPPRREPIQSGTLRSLLVVAVLPDQTPLVSRLRAAALTPAETTPFARGAR